MVELYIPKREDLWFRETITPFPKSDEEAWFSDWMEQKDKFYAYIRRKSDGKFIGEVQFDQIFGKKSHKIHLLIEKSERGKGYAVPALTLLIHHAFALFDVEAFEVDFDIERHEIAAWKTCFSVGFREKSRENGILLLDFTRAMWLQQLDEEDDEEESDPFYSFRMRF